MRARALLGAGAVAFVVVVPMLHITGPVYPHPRVMAHHASVTRYQAPYVTPSASSAHPKASGGHHLAAGYLGARLARHVIPRRWRGSFWRAWRPWRWRWNRN